MLLGYVMLFLKLIMTPNKYINKLLIEAKIGNKTSFNELWRIYRPLLKDIMFSFKKVYKFLKFAEFDIFQKFNIFFWRMISKYSFSSDVGFSHFLKTNIILMMIEDIKREHRLSDKETISLQAIESLIINKKPDRRKIENKEKIRNITKIFTTKQLQAVIMYHYYGMTIAKCSELLDIRFDTFQDRLFESYKKMRNSYHGMRKDTEKGKKYVEKAYEYKTTGGKK